LELLKLLEVLLEAPLEGQILMLGQVPSLEQMPQLEQVLSTEAPLEVLPSETAPLPVVTTQDWREAFKCLDSL